MLPDVMLRREKDRYVNETNVSVKDKDANVKSVNDNENVSERKSCGKSNKSENVNVKKSESANERRKKDVKWKGEKWNVNVYCNSNACQRPKLLRQHAWLAVIVHHCATAPTATFESKKNLAKMTI